MLETVAQIFEHWPLFLSSTRTINFFRLSPPASTPQFRGCLFPRKPDATCVTPDYFQSFLKRLTDRAPRSTNSSHARVAHFPHIQLGTKKKKKKTKKNRRKNLPPSSAVSNCFQESKFLIKRGFSERSLPASKKHSHIILQITLREKKHHYFNRHADGSKNMSHEKVSAECLKGKHINQRRRLFQNCLSSARLFPCLLGNA